MIVDCSDDAQWAAYLERNPLIRSFGHLRPGGTRELPVPEIRRPDSPPRSYPLVICGAPGVGKTALLDLLGVPAACRLPEVEVEDGPEGLLAYAKLLRARGYPPFLESSVRDTFGPYALRAVARGSVLTDEFKAAAIREMTESHQTGGHLTIWISGEDRTDLDEIFARHYTAMPITDWIPRGSPNYMAVRLKARRPDLFADAIDALNKNLAFYYLVSESCFLTSSPRDYFPPPKSAGGIEARGR